ncbi:hypothetical protein IJ670_03155, partial [bacterium]|nr:hypothetical protein [bacterium]
MKRRDLIKAGMILAGTSALCACNKKPAITNNIKEEEIIPKQTDTYKLSTPIPYCIETIDGLAKLNQKYKKSQFVTLYNNIQRPYITEFNEWLQVGDGSTPSVRSFEEFAKFAKHAMSQGFQICYLLNSPKPYTITDFGKFKDVLYKLLEDLANIGVKNIKVGNTQTATLVNEFNPDFKLSSSTAFEFHDVSQYISLMKAYPNINLFDIAIDENHNFGFLRNLKKLFPNVDIEVMVNEPCIKGCPARSSHVSSVTFSVFNCFIAREKRPYYYAMKSPGIY